MIVLIAILLVIYLFVGLAIGFVAWHFEDPQPESAGRYFLFYALFGVPNFLAEWFI